MIFVLKHDLDIVKMYLYRYKMRISPSAPRKLSSSSDSNVISWIDTRAELKQESIPVRCILPACADRMCFNINTSGRGPEVNKFEQVCSDGH